MAQPISLTSALLQARLMAFGAGYPGEVTVYNDWSAAADLDRIVPYGPR